MGLTATKKGTERVTLRFDAPIMARLNEYHKKTEIPKTRIINKALQNYLDELEEDYADARAGEAAWAAYVANGRKSISLEEYARKEGINLEN